MSKGTALPASDNGTAGSRSLVAQAESDTPSASRAAVIEPRKVA
jgi:hypothetical protein